MACKEDFMRGRNVLAVVAVLYIVGVSSIAGVSSALAQPASSTGAYGGSLTERSTLTGNWGGARDDLANKGIIFLPSVTQFYQGATAGNTPHRF
jgi:hypothetical protein